MRAFIDSVVMRMRAGAVTWNVIYGLYFLVIANAGLHVFAPHDTAFGYSAYRAVGMALAVVAIACAPIQILRAWSASYVAIAFVAWSIISMAWAPSLSKAALQSLQLVAMFAVAMAMMIHLGRVRSALVLGGAMTIASGLSLVVMALFPRVGFIRVDHPNEGFLEQGIGVFGWNSELGIAAALGALVCACSLVLRFRKRTVIYLVINLAALYLTDSATSVVALLAGVAVLLLVVFRLARYIAIGAVFLGIAAGFIVGWSKLIDSALSLLGRSENLTGRTEIWAATIGEILKRPWQGYGIGATADYVKLVGRYLDHAHNGAIQLAYERGLVGLVLFLAMVVIAIVGLFRRPRHALRWISPPFAAVLVANYANNYVTSVTLAGFVIIWAIAASASLRQFPDWVQRPIADVNVPPRLQHG